MAFLLPRDPFAGGGGDQDSAVIKHLIDNVFETNFCTADHRLRQLGRKTGFVYSSCVLFPETFIHYLEEVRTFEHKNVSYEAVLIAVQRGVLLSSSNWDKDGLLG